MILGFVFCLSLCFHSYVESLSAWQYIRVVGGEPADIKEFPHQLAMETKGQIFCGASIISRSWAVTAAHCALGVSQKQVLVRAGATKRLIGGTLHKVEKIIVHPNYNETNQDNDVAVVKVTSPFNYSDSVLNIMLAAETPLPGTPAVVSGYGLLMYLGSLPVQLQKVQVYIVDHEECEKSYPKTDITQNMLCAGVSEGGRDACSGDSGGPLMVGKELVGIVSWGYNCAEKGYPGIYTDVAKVRSWITSIVTEESRYY